MVENWRQAKYIAVMIAQNELKKIATSVATANLSASAVKDVLVEPRVDSRGEEGLRITIVIQPDAVSRISGDAALNTLVEMQARIRDAGDERFPIVQYATEDELQESGD
jgi:hypothetical protein